MGYIAPSTFAGHSMLCPYESKSDGNSNDAELLLFVPIFPKKFSGVGRVPHSTSPLASSQGKPE